MLTHTHLFDLAWAEMYSVLATFIWRFNFRFVKAKAEDLECISDQFFIGTRAVTCIVYMIGRIQKRSSENCTKESPQRDGDLFCHSL